MMGLMRKLARARELGFDESSRRVRARFGFKPTVRRIAYSLDRYSRRLYDGPYVERPETGALNIAVKLDRQRQGGPFEPPEIVLVNRAAASLIAPHHRRIFEAGSGTGLFASFVATEPRRTIVASEFDDGARAWAAEHRSRPNIEYCARPFDGYDPKSFDVAVAIEVIEHIGDYPSFLRGLARTANEAIVTTPNRQRSPFTSVDRTPAYSEHVREWTAGELFWVLRCFYRHVELFTIPDMPAQMNALLESIDYRPRLAPCSDLTCEPNLIARCSGALA